MKKLFYVLFAWLVAVQCAFAAVNINTATLEELEQLPGVGPAKAQAIIDDRTQNGKFKNAEDLKRVKGIGDGIFDKLKSEITVTGATTGVSAAAGASKARTDKKVDGKADKKAEKKAEKQNKKPD
ncbi:Competence protein ComEA helix-hairpin-helix repeat protein [Sterolibacterium denitrificans]|uniref:Competence protein ComEA helix-hairpin-helix repeat protein n=1 Tax=Sterolibacterium denitrificans TaxID=157592 RepID=A0A7Z7HRP1_9PROT|nr:ComEA family DNA-binding protein [Sterolibacterium denitrificans]SMB27672.1 Competence protein ComEA helix-hairpin-helix repeat protein [Sterolibacterium denitrificans]